MVNARDDLDAAFRAVAGSPPVEWVISDGLTPYPEAVAEMERRAGLIADGRASERVWLVEHPPLYTAGTSADPADPTAAVIDSQSVKAPAAQSRG